MLALVLGFEAAYIAHSPSDSTLEVRAIGVRGVPRLVYHRPLQTAVPPESQTSAPAAEPVAPVEGPLEQPTPEGSESGGGGGTNEAPAPEEERGPSKEPEAKPPEEQ